MQESSALVYDFMTLTLMKKNIFNCIFKYQTFVNFAPLYCFYIGVGGAGWIWMIYDLRGSAHLFWTAFNMHTIISTVFLCYFLYFCIYFVHYAGYNNSLVAVQPYKSIRFNKASLSKTILWIEIHNNEVLNTLHRGLTDLGKTIL